MKILIFFNSTSGKSYHRIHDIESNAPEDYLLKVIDDLKSVGFATVFSQDKEMVVLRSDVIESIRFDFIDDVKKQ
ncbi:MAG: hypothetical protein HQK52_22210 [Oligoflexia bacterium]|nr:hypothetical protein [Oligoflexia bacterium]